MFDVSDSTEAFVRMVCLIAVRRSLSGRTGCRWCGRIGKTLRLRPPTCPAPSRYASPDPSVKSTGDQGPPPNDHQRATWYCLHSTTTAVGHRPLYSRCPGAISRRSERTSPYYGSFVLATPTEPPGRNRRELRSATGPSSGRHRRSFRSLLTRTSPSTK